MDLAAKTSKVMHHNYIGTEHILVGLLRERTGVAAKVLLDAGIEEEKLTELIEDLIAPSASVAVLDPDGYSPRTEKVLENADKEAERFHCREVGTEHLLIALIKETDCAAVRLLNTLGVDLSKLFVEILIAMGEDPNQYKEELQGTKKRKTCQCGTDTDTGSVFPRSDPLWRRTDELDPGNRQGKGDRPGDPDPEPQRQKTIRV